MIVFLTFSILYVILRGTLLLKHVQYIYMISLARFDWLLCDYNVVIPFYIIYLRNIEND